MAHCAVCSEHNPDNARFCLACGAQLEQTAGRAGGRKTVTVLFADVVDSTMLIDRLDPESVRMVLDRYYESMREAIGTHGGTVEKFIGDAVMAVFGIPQLHEDDALRAVRAAADMREALSRLNGDLDGSLGMSIEMRIGIETGEVVGGDPAGGHEFVTGDPVNVAARLEAGAAPGEIRIGESTHGLVCNAVTTESLGRIALKGRAVPVGAYRLLSVRTQVPARRRESAFVGRKSELESLYAALDDVSRNSAPRLVTVIGTAGVGKSRLVEEFLETRGDDALTIRGRCLPYGEGITFWPLKEAIAGAAGLKGDESADAARAGIRALLGAAADAELVTERVAETIGIATALAEHKGGSWAVQRLFEEISKKRPLIAVFDDIQWAESTFLELIDALATGANASPILVLCMARPELLDTHLSWAGTDDHASQIFLRPLSAEESRRLLANLLGGAELEGTARTRIVEVSDGLPLFVEEMVAMLVEEGALRRDDGRWIASDLSRINAPATIQALLAARLDRLDDALRVVLERGSIEGQVFHRGAVEFLSPESERLSVEALLSELVLKELVEPAGGDLPDEDAFRFHHLLLRDVAYESVRKEDRAALHQRYAAWLDDQAGDRVSEFDEIAGYHLEQSYRYERELSPGGNADDELAERAAGRLGRAGLRAHARGDWAGAANLLTRSLGLLPQDSDLRANLSTKLRDASVEMAPAKPGLVKSVACFWRWPVGHRWTVKERGGILAFRCARCGKERPRRGDEEYAAWRRHDHAYGGGNGGGAGADGGGGNGGG